MKRISLESFSLQQIQSMLADLESDDPNRRKTVLVAMNLTEDDIQEWLDDIEKQKLYGRFFEKLYYKN